MSLEAAILEHAAAIRDLASAIKGTPAQVKASGLEAAREAAAVTGAPVADIPDDRTTAMKLAESTSVPTPKEIGELGVKLVQTLGRDVAIAEVLIPLSLQKFSDAKSPEELIAVREAIMKAFDKHNQG